MRSDDAPVRRSEADAPWQALRGRFGNPGEDTAQLRSSAGRPRSFYRFVRGMLHRRVAHWPLGQLVVIRLASAEVKPYAGTVG